MGKLKRFFTLKIRLDRHGFEFHHRPLNNRSKALNIALMAGMVAILFSLWAIPIAIILLVVTLVYKEPEREDDKNGK